MEDVKALQLATGTIRYSKWEKLYVCECGEVYYHPFPDLLYSKCGNIVDTKNYRVGRWIRTSKLLQSSSWFSSYIEYKE